MNLKTILTLIIISTLIILSAGCITHETEIGTATYNPIQDTVTIDVDTYDDDGLHITGKTVVTSDGDIISINCDVNGYINGDRVTGVIIDRNGYPYWIWTQHVDRYKDGGHITGTIKIEGFKDEPTEIYYNLIRTKSGYKTQILRGNENAEWEII